MKRAEAVEYLRPSDHVSSPHAASCVYRGGASNSSMLALSVCARSLWAVLPRSSPTFRHCSL
jgi:hypothetical protein